MKAIIATDDIYSVGNLKEDCDTLITLGDFHEPKIHELIGLYKPKDTLAVRGNHDTMRPFDEPIQNLHLNTLMVNGITFGGFSGSWKYKDSIGWLYWQDEVFEMMRNFPRVDVFLAHNSPFGVHERDDYTHQGFKAFNTYIEEMRPELFLHGHQHQNLASKIGTTEIIGVYGERTITI